MKMKALRVVCSVGFLFLGSVAVADGDGQYEWIDVAALDVGSRGFASDEEKFVRLPKAERELAPAAIRGMARESTGLNFKFKTTSKKLVFRYAIEKRAWTDPLIPPSGLQSVSVWGRWKGSKEWEFVGKNHPKADGNNEYRTSWNPDRTGWLYFPMRSVVKSFRVGIEKGAKFERIGYANEGKVVVYGTSIVHGGCVSSAGMMFTSFLGRRLDRDVVNLGFSGGGKMELEMAELLSRIDALLYVVDCDWNMTLELQKERYEPFVRRLRSLRPATPILLCGGCTERKYPLKQEVFAKSIFDKLKKEDPKLWKNLYFLSGVDALPKCSWATHDHCHPNDLGAPFMGEVYAKRIAEIIASSPKPPALAMAENALYGHMAMLGAERPECEFVFAPAGGEETAKEHESVCRVEGKRVYLWGDDSVKAGSARHGTLFAVSLFLEKELGFKWLWSGKNGTLVGKKRFDCAQKARTYRYSPPLVMSKLRNPDKSVSYWTQRYRKTTPRELHVSNSQLHQEHLQRNGWKLLHRHQNREIMQYGHAFTKWHERFAKTAPELLALNAATGERGFHAANHPETVKLCVSNDATVDRIIEDWKQGGCRKYLNVCENDGANYCQCGSCRALDARTEGEKENDHLTDRYLDFWNRIAEKAVKVRPDVQIVAYAYSSCRQAPRKVKVLYPDNIVLGFVPGTMERSKDVFEPWRKAGARQMFLRPNHCYYYGSIPRGLERFLYDEFHYCLENGMIGVDYDAQPSQGAIRLEIYMLARMIADPEASFDEICEEFYSAYGAAADDVKAYFEKVRERGEELRRLCLDGVEPYARRFTDCAESVPFGMNCSEQRLLEEKAILDKAMAEEKVWGAERERLKDLLLRAEHAILAYKVYKASKFAQMQFHKTFTGDEARVFEKASRELFGFRVRHLHEIGDDNFALFGYPWAEGGIWGKSQYWWDVKDKGDAASEDCRKRLRAAVADDMECFITQIDEVEVDGKKAVEVCYSIRPHKDSFIRCRVALPMKDRWSGRMWGYGKGGWAGSDSSIARNTRSGDAAATCDLGTGRSTGWTRKHWPEPWPDAVWKDFGWRATHLMTVYAKKFCKAFYGREPDKSYFIGASTGGGQALHEAQRFPEDYDGIVSELPANSRVALEVSAFHRSKLARRLRLDDRRRKILADAPVEFMADKDVPFFRGKYLSDPRLCEGREREIIDIAAKKDPVFAEKDVQAAIMELFGGKVHRNRRGHGGYCWGAAFSGDAGLFLFKIFYASKYARKYDGNLATWDDFDEFVALRKADLNATDPDLGAFSKRGGKIMMTVGMEDQTIPYSAILDYYEDVAAKMGGIDKTREFFRMYLLPGCAHGGIGREMRSCPIEEVKSDMVNWVEKGIVPVCVRPKTKAGNVLEIPAYPQPVAIDGHEGVSLRGVARRIDSFYR